MTVKNKVLVFTGGHHTSSLAVAKQLMAAGWIIYWFGHRHTMWGDISDSAEYRDVTAAGITFFDLKAGKLYHTYHPLKLIRLPFGFLQAGFYLLKLKLDPCLKLCGVVSFGGYLAVPTVISGWLLGIPSLTHDQTTGLGWANKLITPFVKVIAVSWPASLKFCPPAKSVLTGLPLRPELLSLSSPPSPSRFKTIYVTGGKQGSHIINQAIFAAVSELVKTYKIIHQTGSSTVYHDYEKSLEFAKRFSNYSSFDYDSSLALAAYSQADLIISRAGAHTIYELAVLGKPCLLIPIPWVSHNEQNQNAQILVANRQAIVLSEVDLSSDHLIQAISSGLALSPRALSVPRDGLTRLIQLIEQTFPS